MKWLEVREAPVPKGYKTKRWDILSAESGAHLGRISWFSGWRRYVFSPTPGAVFEQDCLRDLADFVERETVAHKGK